MKNPLAKKADDEFFEAVERSENAVSQEAMVTDDHGGVTEKIYKDGREWIDAFYAVRDQGLATMEGTVPERRYLGWIDVYGCVRHLLPFTVAQSLPGWAKDREEELLLRGLFMDAEERRKFFTSSVVDVVS